MVDFLTKLQGIDINNTGKVEPSLFLALKLEARPIAQKITEILLTNDISKKLNVKHRDPALGTCLHLVARYNLVNIAKILLGPEYNIPLDGRNKDGDPPIRVASKVEAQSIVALIIQAGNSRKHRNLKSSD